jgi:hypothetical protein
MGWSKELKALSYKTLDDGIMSAFVNGGVCHLKNFDGRYGSISMGNAMMRIWSVDLAQGGTENYKELDEILDSGWAID